MHLIVRNAFGGHARGDRITDPVAVAIILAGENEGHVVRVPADAHGQASPAAPEPEAPAEIIEPQPVKE